MAVGAGGAVPEFEADTQPETPMEGTAVVLAPAATMVVELTLAKLLCLGLGPPLLGGC